MKIVACIKQVPDTTAEIKIDKETSTLALDGVENITNPFDEFAVEEALLTREKHGGEVHVITMGPPHAIEVLRNALAMGVDQAYLACDTAFAGADTLATAYTLSKAIEKIGDVDLVFCGKQAIDGDTAQVGPQVAEKLGVPQITYAETIDALRDGEIVATRALPLGTETVRSTLPCLLTVVGSANRPRPPSVRRMMVHKLSATPLEYSALLQQWPEFESEAALDRYLAERGLRIPVWSAADVGADSSRVGLSGSPTKVLNVDFVVLESSGSQEFEATPEGVAALMQELVEEYIL